MWRGGSNAIKSAPDGRSAPALSFWLNCYLRPSTFSTSSSAPRLFTLRERQDLWSRFILVQKAHGSTQHMGALSTGPSESCGDYGCVVLVADSHFTFCMFLA